MLNSALDLNKDIFKDLSNHTGKFIEGMAKDVNITDLINKDPMSVINAAFKKNGMQLYGDLAKEVQKNLADSLSLAGIH